MKEETVSDALLRAFLLGKVDDEERERIENLFLTDSQERERVLSAEQDLIEDYLENNLTIEDKQRFIALYAQTREQRQKLGITKTIKDWAMREAALPATADTKVSRWARLRAKSWLKPVFVIPIAVTAMIAIVIAVVWLNSRERNRRHLAIEQELAQLNTPSSLREVPSQMVAQDLSPAAVRGAEREPEIRKSVDVRLVELRLPWVREDRYSSYQIQIGRVGEDESYTIRNLQGEGDGRYVVRVRIPTHLLNQGQYLIRLSGVNADGTSGLLEEYLFTVND
jgi:hypothetical protein